MAGLHGTAGGRVIISRVQTGVLGIAVVFCTVMLLRGIPGPGNIYVVAVVFFGVSFLGHLTFLLLTRRSTRAAARSDQKRTR